MKSSRKALGILVSVALGMPGGIQAAWAGEAPLTPALSVGGEAQAVGAPEQGTGIAPGEASGGQESSQGTAPGEEAPGLGQDGSGLGDATQGGAGEGLLPDGGEAGGAGEADEADEADEAGEGALAGTDGTEAPEAFAPEGEDMAPAAAASVLRYQAHVSGAGWMAEVQEGATAGTTGQFRQMEALCARLDSAPAAGSISYSVHASNIGWMAEVQDGAI
ncbi:MAG: hypothetical protein LBG81_01585, partial [Coriobacteriaceae bacterium]|nr:hypothetical protein [Coriobacteriaceae bacterium]